MIIGCILCGGVGETMLVIAGFSWLINWFKKNHNRNKCECCKEHKELEEAINGATKDNKTLTPEEKSSINEFYMAQFKDKGNQDDRNLPKQ
jgi:hypothetical protein